MLPQPTDQVNSMLWKHNACQAGVGGRLGFIGTVGFILLVAGISKATNGTTAETNDILVDVELVLAVDVSGSIDLAEARLQRQGYVTALTSPELVDAIKRGGFGRIAITYVEWSGQRQQRIVTDWMLIEDVESAQDFATAVRAQPVTVEEDRRTSLSGAIAFSAELFDGNGFGGTRRVIDISGDGKNNVGHVVTTARDRALADGLTINGLPIVNARLNPSGAQPPADLAQYYRDCVIGGPGAFTIVADGYDAFGPAILKKLVLEIAGITPRLWRAGYEGPFHMWQSVQYGRSGCLHTL